MIALHQIQEFDNVYLVRNCILKSMHEKNDNLQNLSALQQQRDFEKRAWQYECDQLTSKLRFFDRHLPECLRVCRQRIVDKYSVLHNDTQVDRLRLGLLPSAKSNPGSLFCKDRNVKRFSPKNMLKTKKKSMILLIQIFQSLMYLQFGLNTKLLITFH